MPTVSHANLIEELQFYSLERVRHQKVEAALLQPLFAFSQQVSPYGQPDWWVRLLLAGRQEFFGLPRAYLGDNIRELIQEVKLHQAFRTARPWGRVRIVEGSVSGDTYFDVQNANWGLACQFKGPRIEKQQLLALLRLHGYLIDPINGRFDYDPAELLKLEFDIDLWVGDQPILSSFSVAKFLHE